MRFKKKKKTDEFELATYSRVVSTDDLGLGRAAGEGTDVHSHHTTRSSRHKSYVSVISLGWVRVESVFDPVSLKGVRFQIVKGVN